MAADGQPGREADVDVPAAPRRGADVEVLVVGAGPTGLTLAAQLAAFGTSARIVDRNLDRTTQSRAVAIQPRTLEVLAPLGVTDSILRLGRSAVHVRLHFGARVRTFPLFDIGIDDTAYPNLCFLSQAETERLLGEHLATRGVEVERGTQLLEYAAGPDGVDCTLRHPDGARERLRARFVAGCDGPRSTVRQQAGIAFPGSEYPQTFVLADLEADGLEPDAVHVFMSGPGAFFFFPLGTPATWRMLAMLAGGDPSGEESLGLAELQAMADRQTGRGVRLHDPVWITPFRLHNRGADRYRAGGAFLAGDAAHIHSPAGGQGMNVGIQDAVNLGWKLALVCRGVAGAELLDSYDAERRPVGHEVRRTTDRAFTVATSRSRLARFARDHLVPRLVPLVLGTRAGRGLAFRSVSELGLGYRDSPLSTQDGSRRDRPAAGDRLPDAPLRIDGDPTTLHRATAAPGLHLLLCGPAAGWPADAAAALAARYPDLLHVHRIGDAPGPGVLHDDTGQAARRLGMRSGDVMHFLVRPDGYLGFRAPGADLAGLAGYLSRWLPGAPDRHRPPAR